MRLGALNPATRQQFNVPDTVKSGAVVESVSSDSDAAHIGIRPGYVIQRAGDRTVSSGADVAAAVADALRERRPSILLLINMNGRTAFVPVKLDTDDSGK